MSNPVIQRYYELLVDQSTVGLDAAAKAELDNIQRTLMQADSSRECFADAEEIEKVAALVDQALATSADTGMPDEIARQVLQTIDQQAVAATSDNVHDISTKLAARKTAGGFQRLGWYAAAASLVMAVYFGIDRQPEPNMVDLAEQRETMLRQDDVQFINWSTPTEVGYQQVTGDVVWNNNTQQGYMRLVNLPINDPDDAQYQLWIVDPSRDSNPVDGGVFDITQTGEVLIPIDAKLAIISPAAFAITREQPGGVVVSDGPLLVVAAVEV